MEIIERGEPQEASQMQIALAVGAALNAAYPNHPWLVGFQGGGIVVRHMAIAAAVERVIGKSGFASLLPADKLGTPHEIRRSAIEFGGQLLEAFGLRRGAWHGEDPIVPNWRRGKQRDFH